MKNIKSLIRDIFLFHPENSKEPFILEEPQKRREEDEKEDIGKERGKEDDSSNSEAKKAHSNARNKENKLREQV
ncbi:MAG: hypothetical protein GX115_13910, partial [Ruminiclostridium sp.]|nr:hypothetical protein [Ruminiclostridium sp.]